MCEFDRNHPSLMCQAVGLGGWKWISEDENEVAELDRTFAPPNLFNINVSSNCQTEHLK